MLVHQDTIGQQSLPDSGSKARRRKASIEEGAPYGSIRIMSLTASKFNLLSVGYVC